MVSILQSGKGPGDEICITEFLRKPIKTSDRMVERHYLTCATNVPKNLDKEDVVSCF